MHPTIRPYLPLTIAIWVAAWLIFVLALPAVAMAKTDLVVVTDAPPKSMNPHAFSSDANLSYMSNFFDGLLQRPAPDGKLAAVPKKIAAAATTLAVFFLGLASGSLVLGRRAAGLSRPLRVYALLEWGIAAAALLVVTALVVLRSLDDPERSRGVVAASTGNHGMAVACAARELSCRALIFVPENAVESKVEAIRAYGRSGAPVEVPAVAGDRVQLQQVILNFVVNAIEALKAGRPDDRDLLVSLATDGRKITLSVRDNGVGFDRRYHEKIFGLFDRLDGTRDGRSWRETGQHPVIGKSHGVGDDGAPGVGHGQAVVFFCKSLAAPKRT